MNNYGTFRREAELQIECLISDHFEEFCKKDTANVETIDAIYMEEIAPWITMFSDPEDDELSSQESLIASKFATAWLAENGIERLTYWMRPADYCTKADFNRAKKALKEFIEEQINIDFGSREAMTIWERENALLGI